MSPSLQLSTKTNYLFRSSAMRSKSKAAAKRHRLTPVLNLLWPCGPPDVAWLIMTFCITHTIKSQTLRARPDFMLYISNEMPDIMPALTHPDASATIIAELPGIRILAPV
jgi:hypothetical protein